MTIPAPQAAAAALLRRLSGAAPIETHISAVFVGPDAVWKLKKAVALGFLDFTALTERERLREKYERERLGQDPGGDYDSRQDDGYPQPATPRRRRGGIGRWVVRGTGIGIILLVIAIAWLAFTAPLSKSLEPPAPPSITLLSAEGTPIAERGDELSRVLGDRVEVVDIRGRSRFAYRFAQRDAAE